ncbi:HNH endonuclease [Pseudogracilibacillus auburnensis]|uniref:HNH endonuclease n=1 Tax=Pseudogracilibacillus auburnensis TaxID=1494959 RepID=A0A2V3VIG7_9BACI|nr:HNH endonuclease [Pseudogracilibacillus auburnensis]PXW81636.1 HNH endonuclease [Pseudogracilibacillus auburnensis]
MSSLIKCIFCLEDRKGSKEHIFPDSIGGLLVFYNVCKECNNKLGRKVDTHLVNHTLIEFVRLTKKIKGKSGKIPNPLGKGVLDGEDSSKVHYRFNSEGEPESLYIVPSQTVSEDGKSIRFSVDATDEDKLASMVNKTLKRKGLPTLSLEEIEEQIQREKTEKPKMHIKLKVDLNSYRKAILKIIYEFTSFILGEEYLDDPLSEKIREYIKSDSLEIGGLIGNVDLVNKETPRLEVLSMLAIESGHIACLIQERDNLVCYVNIFNQFEGYLVVSENASRYPKFEGVFYENNVENKTLRNSLFVNEISERFS